MNLLQYAGKLYSLDTLDKRFTASSRALPSRIDPVRSSPEESSYKRGKARGNDVASEASPPRWKTPEFIYHGLVFLIAVPLMFKTVIDVSKSKVLIILYINYNIATQLKKEYVPAVTWIFNIGILFANELGKGYPYSTIANVILPWSAPSEPGAEQKALENWGAVLDSYGGLIPRWEILFNVTVLRLISFNLDYYWSLNRSGGSPIEVMFELRQQELRQGIDMKC
ncbi:hypothetical protein P7C71_g3778, partial [Lecanoromycetidae sp. Uapishka_2]